MPRMDAPPRDPRSLLPLTPLAFHVLWSLIAADAWVVDARLRGDRWTGLVAWTWAILIALSCLTTSMHTVIDLAAAILLFVVLRDRVWLPKPAAGLKARPPAAV